MPGDLLTYLVGSLSFGLSTAFGIRFRHHLTLPTAAALAPPVAASALSQNGLHPVSLLIGPSLAVVILVVARRSIREITSHVSLFMICSGIIYAVLPKDDSSVLRTMVLSLALTLLYSAGEVARQKLDHPGRLEIKDRLMGLLLLGVLLCASGLTVLVVDRMGWPTFFVMVGVLGLTRREFEAFALSRATYEQTLRALDRLAERAERERLINT